MAKWPIGTAPRSKERWPKYRENNPTCDVPLRKTQNQNEKNYFSILTTRPGEAVEGLYSSLA